MKRADLIENLLITHGRPLTVKEIATKLKEEGHLDQKRTAKENRNAVNQAIYIDCKERGISSLPPRFHRSSYRNGRVSLSEVRRQELDQSRGRVPNVNERGCAEHSITWLPNLLQILRENNLDVCSSDANDSGRGYSVLVKSAPQPFTKEGPRWRIIVEPA